jgi:hypothetical protein
MATQNRDLLSVGDAPDSRHSICGSRNDARAIVANSRAVYGFSITP